jgi:hypothetical protein
MQHLEKGLQPFSCKIKYVTFPLSDKCAPLLPVIGRSLALHGFYTTVLPTEYQTRSSVSPVPPDVVLIVPPEQCTLLSHAHNVLLMEGCALSAEVLRHGEVLQDVLSPHTAADSIPE